MKRKGIILAGGGGSRLYPVTIGVSKQLLPVFDKPMIYYPLSVVMLADIRDVLVISTPEDSPCFQKLLGDGSHLGMNIHYIVQPSPDGLAQAFLLGEKFLNGSPSMLILGDNIFYSHLFQHLLKSTDARDEGATIFAYRVQYPQRYGVVEFNQKGKVLGLEEKPKGPKSNYAVTGLYFYDKNAPYYAKELKPSRRGELEITDLNKSYLKNEKLFLEILGRGHAWFDAGTHQSLMEAGQFVQTIERRQGLKIACLEEIAFRKNWIDGENVMETAHSMKGSSYAKYLMDIVSEGANGGF